MLGEVERTGEDRGLPLMPGITPTPVSGHMEDARCLFCFHSRKCALPNAAQDHMQNDTSR
jgi:hypothetical protein